MARESKQAILEKIYAVMDGFNTNSEEECVNAIRKSGPCVAEKIPKDRKTDRIEREILKRDPSYILKMKNPDDGAVANAIQREPTLFYEIKDAGLINDKVVSHLSGARNGHSKSEIMEMLMVEGLAGNWEVEWYVKDIFWHSNAEKLFDKMHEKYKTEKIYRSFVSGNWEVIKKIENPSEEVMRAAIEKAGWSNSIAHLLKDAPRRIKEYAIKTNQDAYFEFNDKSFVELHLKHHPSAIRSIKITKKLKKIIIQSDPGVVEHSKYFKPTMEDYELALSVKPQILKYIVAKVPPKVATQAIGDNVELFKDIFGWRRLNKDDYFKYLLDCIKARPHLIKHLSKNDVSGLRKEELFQLLLVI
jgi:hypothetical protein